MTTPTQAPSVLPTPPPSRVEMERFGVFNLWFDSWEEYKAYKKESFWRRLFGMTAYHRKLKNQKA